MSDGDIGVFIPAYNAGATLPLVMARLPSELWPRLTIVAILNDGSVDDTQAVAESLAQGHAKVRVIQSDGNQGYGKTVRRGLGLCREAGCEIAVCLHADGQYPPERILEFAEHMRRYKIDLLQGSRHRDGKARAGGMPFYKIAGGKALTWLENKGLGHRLTDPHSGFMLYGRRAIQNIPFERLSGYFDFDLEVIATALALGLKVDELSIPARYAGERSYLNPVRYGWRALRMILKYRFGHYVRLTNPTSSV